MTREYEEAAVNFHSCLLAVQECAEHTKVVWKGFGEVYIYRTV